MLVTIARGNRMYGGICELAAENGASGGCFRRPFHHNIKNVNVLKEDKMINSACHRSRHSRDSRSMACKFQECWECA
jgi:hypothetical protein